MQPRTSLALRFTVPKEGRANTFLRCQSVTLITPSTTQRTYIVREPGDIKPETQEHRNLCYVAVTRAKQVLTFVDGPAYPVCIPDVASNR